MKKILTLIALLYFPSIYAQINVDWIAKYETSPDSKDSPKNMIVDYQNNVYVVGYTSDIGSSFRDIVLIKYDDNGSELWRTVYSHGSENDYLGSSILINGYIYITCSYPTTTLINTLYLMKFSMNGVFLEESVIATIESQEYEWRSVGNIKLLYKENFFYFSYTISSFLELTTTKLIKIDLSSTIIWEKTYYHMLATSLRFNNEGNLVLVGRNNLAYYTNPNGVEFDTKCDAFVRKISVDGTEIWNTTISSPEECFEQFLHLTTDEYDNIYTIYYKQNYINYTPTTIKKFNNLGEFVWDYVFEHPISGTNNFLRNLKYNNSKIYLNGRSNIPNTPNILTLCLDEEGSLNWFDNFITEPEFTQISGSPLLGFDNNGNIYSIGSRYGLDGSTRSDVFFKIYKSNGTPLEEFYFNSTGNAEEHESQVEMKLNTIYLAGASDKDIMTIKFSNQYASSTSDLNIGTLKVLPNPFNDNLHISLTGNNHSGSLKIITIFNMLGEKLYSTGIWENETSIKPQLASGVYYLTISDNSQLMFSSKIIKINNSQ